MGKKTKWRSPFGRLGAERISDSKFNELLDIFGQLGAASVATPVVHRHAKPPWPLEVHFSENGPEIQYMEFVIEIIETGQEIVLTLDGMRSLANLLNEAIEVEDAGGAVA